MICLKTYFAFGTNYCIFVHLFTNHSELFPFFAIAVDGNGLDDGAGHIHESTVEAAIVGHHLIRAVQFCVGFL